MAKRSQERIPKHRWGCLRLFLATLIVIFVAFKLLMFHEREEIRQSDLLQKARAINLLMFAYADDHEGRYPDGKSSTEVFQKLIDGGYVADRGAGSDGPAGPEVFYFPMPGKAKPTSRLLKIENVCWDVTSGMTVANTPNEIPSVYMTGYKVTFRSGASATPEAWPPRTWWEWLTAADYPRGYIVVGYQSSGDLILKADSDGSIPNFIPASSESSKSYSQPNGKLVLDTRVSDMSGYKQLTPDGSLP